ncbi:MAG: hypothetical protein WCG34_06225 [Leptolinea sp.]
MTARLNDHEWEMLSAYMDGRVSSAEKAQLEQRLQANPEMAAAYSSLVKTRAILQATPRVKRRRNFYLTSEMLRPKSWIWIIPALNFGSTAAAGLAILLFVLDIFPLAPVMNRASAVPEAAQMVQDSAARPSAAEKIELGITPVAEVAAAQEQDGGNEKNVIAPEEPVLPAAKLAGNGASGEIDAARAPAAPVTSQPIQGSADVGTSPSQKEAPGETMSQPATAPPAMPPQSEGMPSSYTQVENTAQPQAEQIEPTIEPTNLAVEEIATPVSAKMLTTATDQIPAQPEQKMAVGAVQDQLQVETAPAIALIAPTVESARPAKVEQSIPVSQGEAWTKFGWIALLAISGFLVLLSAILKNKYLK